MKMFRMMSLPAIVGMFLLFCAAPKAAATTCGLDSITNIQLTDSRPIAAAGFLDLRSLLAEDVSPMAMFFNLTDVFTFNTSQFTMASEKGHVWILALLDVPEEAVKGAVTTPASGSQGSGSQSATTLSTTASTAATTVPEPSSLLYLGSSLILGGGYWLRRRRF